MEKLNRKVLDAITGVEVVTELTKEEILEREQLAIANETARIAEDSARLTARTNLLNRLGITDEEAKLLLS